jgi:hypothetical protein
MENPGLNNAPKSQIHARLADLCAFGQRVLPVALGAAAHDEQAAVGEQYFMLQRQ